MGKFSIAMKGFVLFCLWAVIAEAEYMKYKDPKQPMVARIKDLMNRMTLEEKIGQMTQIERKVATPDVIKQYFIGSVLSGGGSVPAPKASAEDWVNMVNEIQKASLSTRLGIPMIYGIDAVHGHNNVYNATIFPHNIGLGVTRDPDLVKRIGAATALEVKATGIPYVFAPCIAIVQAEDTKIMGKFSIAMKGFVLCCLWAVIAEAEYMKYKDPKRPMVARIKDLMNRMTLEEKIGQMTQIERKVASPDVMKQYFIGSVLSGGGSVPAPKASAEVWVNMVNEIQKAALSTHLGIPMIYGIDAVHGHNNVYNATIFPHNIGLGVTRDPDLVKRIGAATALEVKATGIPYVFAPCIAVCRDPRWGRCYESYSEDHNIVRTMTEIIPGLQGDRPANSRKGVPFVDGRSKVAACAKHFVGDGGTVRGIDENNTVINSNGLFGIHMPAYYDSIAKGVSTVMVSYSSWNGKRMHANRDLVTGFLKDKLNFRGFVISDWQGIDRITSPPHANYTYSVQAGISAGIDMVMVPNNYTEFIDTLTLLVKDNIIPMSRINDAVKRILRVKFTMGLFDNPLADLSFVNQLGSQEHRELAREAVRKSLVLLKNGKSTSQPLLPLPKKASKILVAGTHADNLGYQCGGWTVEWQGVAGNDLTVGTTILSAIKKTVDPSTRVVYQQNPDANFVKSNKFDYAIVVVGEVPYAEMYGDSSNLTITEPGPSTINNVCGAVKCGVVIISGRPVVLEPYIDKIDAVVAAWLPGTEGQGVAEVLFGDYGFTGKLAWTWFKSVDQLPMNVDDRNYNPLFPFGFGLTTQPVKTN